MPAFLRCALLGHLWIRTDDLIFSWMGRYPPGFDAKCISCGMGCWDLVFADGELLDKIKKEVLADARCRKPIEIAGPYR